MLTQFSACRIGSPQFSSCFTYHAAPSPWIAKSRELGIQSCTPKNCVASSHSPLSSTPSSFGVEPGKAYNVCGFEAAV